MNARTGYFIGVFAIGASLTCGSPDDETVTSSPANPNGSQPASAAGTPGPDGPGVPADFAGTITQSLPLTAEEVAAIKAADALSAARNPPTQSPLARGFGAVPKKGAP